MGYRDDFYCVQNLYGYTGDIRHFPTIYFVKVTPLGKVYGHITQRHSTPGNVGRMAVGGPDPTYEIGNDRATGRLHETGTGSNGPWDHTSRSSLKTLPRMSANDIAICAQAIWMVPYQKYISAFDQYSGNKIIAQARAKQGITPAALMAQRQHIMAAGDARRLQARNQQLADFNDILARGDLARRKRGF